MNADLFVFLLVVALVVGAVFAAMLGTREGGEHR